MSQNTISVSPLPQQTSIDKIKEIFSAFSVKNVHIDGNTAYVEFADQGDLQNLDIQFDDYLVADLDNAKIDKSDFDWSSLQKQSGNFSQLKSQSSDRHQDLMAADIDNLIVIENCDQQKLNSLSVQAIRQIFKDFHSVHRIVKRNNDVIVQFTDAGEMEKLESSFNNLNVPQLGYKSQIQKVDNYKISPQDFVNQWSKIHNESMITQESTNFGYNEEKPSSGEVYSGNQLGYGSTQEKKSPPHKVLHEDIIPPFDKKTSMQMNFLSEQSNLGYKEEPVHEAIPQATTHQELDYTTEVKINDDEDKLGYSKEVQEQAHRRQEQERKRKQQEEIQRKIEQEQIKHLQQEQRRKTQELQDQRKREEQQTRRKKEQQELHRQRQQEQQRKRQQQQERMRKEEQERKKQQQQQRKRQQQQRKMRQEEQERKRQQEEQKRKQQQQAKQKLEQERKRKFQQERISQELKQKLEAQKQKFKTQHEKLGYQEEAKKQQKHQIPTESENVASETQAIREVGESIEKQLGYAVNMAKAESANLLQAGLDLLKGTEKEETKEKTVPKTQKLGYEKEEPKEIGLNLVNSGLQFLKGSYQKFQEHFGQNAQSQQESKSSDLGYGEKWSVKPDVNVLKPVATSQSKVLRTLVTVTLLIWVFFLLMQDTGSSEVSIISEIQIPTSSQTV